MTDRAAWKPALDPELLPLVEALPSLNLNDETLAAVRSISLRPPFEPSGQVEVTDHIVDPATGLTVRVSRPTEIEGPFGCLYGMHGGGLVVGSAVQSDEIFDRWCPRFGIVGVSVEYRLAPETPYPGPLDDCEAGLLWVVDHAAELGVDPERIGITGISAGGGLCAGLAIRLRDQGGFQPAFQLLDCPMLDHRTQSASMTRNDLLVWTADSNRFGWAAYLGELAESGAVPGTASPAREPDLAGRPPTYLCVGGADGFVDEDVEYAMRLSAAGVPTDFQVHAGLPHGVMVFGNTDAATRYLAGQEVWLASRFGRRLSA
ncbi:MAG: alpha/beta hydrolase [Ilumatobacteraceae bacterium]